VNPEENKTDLEQKPAQADSEVRTLTVANSHHSGSRTVAVDKETGRFTKVNRDLALAERSNAGLKRLLTKAREGKKQTFELEQAEHLGKLILAAEPSDLSGAAKAYEILQTRAWGRPVPSAQEANNMKVAPVTVIIQAPTGIPFMEAKPVPTQPSWVDAEVIQQNPAPNLIEDPEPKKE
jgi:hypothetical protein